MHLVITKDPAESALLAARAITQAVRRKPDLVLGLATGSTPVPVYQEMAAAAARGEADYSWVTAVNLDEYVGLPPDHPQSYRCYMDTHLFSAVGIPDRQVVIPRGDRETGAELERLSAFTDRHRLDLQLLSVGVNGHIGFNEPDTLFHDKYHLVSLTPQTRQSNARFFSGPDEVPTHAITMGVGDILRARQIVFLATGEEKLNAMRAILEPGDISPRCQATILKLHPSCTIFLDRALAGQISPAPCVEISRA